MEVDRENNNTRKSGSYQRKCKYRDLLNRIEGLQESEDVGIQTAKEVGDIFKEVKEVDGQCAFQERVEYAEETYLESLVLSSASSLLVKCIENINIFDSTYEPTDFAPKLLNGLRNAEDEFETNHWLNILEDARKIVPEIPNYSFLYGTFDPTQIPEKEIPKQPYTRESKEVVVKKQLQKVESADKDEEGVDDTVNFLGKVLNSEYEKNSNKPIHYFDFVIDSESYANTIENAFYSAFLVRDGKAKLEVGKNGVVTLEPQRKRDLKTFRSRDGVNGQVLTRITASQWKELSIREGCIQRYRRQARSQSQTD